MADKEVSVSVNQTLFDLALQEAGNIEAVWELAKQNDLSPTDYVRPGTVLSANDLPANTDVVNYYIRSNIRPATADSSIFKGIGYMKIEVDFKIK